MVLGGLLIPLELFPASWQPILRNLPFATIVYGPARLFVHPSLNEAIALLLRQGVALLVLALCVQWVYGIAVFYHGLRRYESGNLIDMRG